MTLQFIYRSTLTNDLHITSCQYVNFRLSYHERIMEMIPQPFQRVFPERSTEPLYKFFESDKGMHVFILYDIFYRIILKPVRVKIILFTYTN